MFEAALAQPLNLTCAYLCVRAVLTSCVCVCVCVRVRARARRASERYMSLPVCNKAGDFY